MALQNAIEPQLTESNPKPEEGAVQGPEKQGKNFEQIASSLPFGQLVSLAEIGGPTYVTAQTLIQQVAYVLSDRLWTYSPETFDLDVAVKSWNKEGAANARGYPTNVQAMEIRSGAANVALGYVFSKDFDLKKRFVPQTIIASTSSLPYLRDSLDQLSLLYTVASPFVAHVAAVDYVSSESAALASDYISAISTAEDIGLGLVSSFSAYESQHMALFSTLLADILPTIHVYDGVTTGRETTRVVDLLDQTSLYKNYKQIQDTAQAARRKHSDNDTKTLQLLQTFNDEFGTDYKPFEYHGHNDAESVLVVFGSVEAAIATQIATNLSKTGAKVGVVNVRIYRPFIEEEFVKVMPSTVKSIGVLGQVQDSTAVSDPSIQSRLYGDVLVAMNFAGDIHPSKILDMKYPLEQAWSPVSIAAALQLLVGKPVLEQVDSATSDAASPAVQLVDPSITQQYIFWDIDESTSSSVPFVLGRALSKDSANNVSVQSKHDNLTQGGIQRVDVRKSKLELSAAFPVDAADVIYVGDESVLKEIDPLASIKQGGKLIIRLPGVKDDDLEKKLSVSTRKAIKALDAQLYIVDPSAIEKIANDADLETYVVQLAWLRVALPNLETTGIQRLAAVNGTAQTLNELAEGLDKVLRQVEIPEAWGSLEEEEGKTPKKYARDITNNSFTPFEKLETEQTTYLKSWQTSARGIVFKEALGAEHALRPDISVPTYTVHVKENRRLTSATYDRNIFHIEFDLGNTGLKYEIGESLGVHAENDEGQVREFMEHYGLQANDIVELSSRDDPTILENRTVFQALMQQVDIFGKPPKKFYEALAEFAENATEKKSLLSLGSLEGVNEFKRRSEVDTVTFADVLLEFASARPSFHDLVKIVSPMKRREYSIASCQKVTPNSVALMIVTVDWVDPRGRDRFGQATRYLNKLRPGDSVVVSVKPSVMKLPPHSTQPLIMAGLGTGLAPFRAFVQHRALEKEQGKDIGAVLLYLGSRHEKEEFCYAEEWKAYQDAGVITLLGTAFSRDQPQKVYIQDRMRQTMDDIIQAYLKEDGAFYLCGPTWPVPDVQNVLEDAITTHGKMQSRKVDSAKEIERLKEDGRYVLEVY